MMRYFVTHIVPKKLIEKLPVSPAGNYFSYNLISGKMFDQVISLVPVNIREKIIDTENKENIKYIQNRFLPHKGIFKVLNVVFENIQLLCSIKNNSNVWFYNLTIHTLFAFLIMRYLRKSIKTYIIVLDHAPSKNKWNINYCILKCINQVDGIITLSTAQEITNPNRVVIPGVIPDKKTIYPKQSNINYDFLLSGILEPHNPKRILDIFSQHPQYTLKITGIVADEKMFIQYAEKYPNIHYYGFLPYDKYLDLLYDVSFAINSRDESIEENKFNFPSKMIEYLLNNKIVISTIFYPQLENINYLYRNEQETLCELFERIEVMNKDLLLKQYANQSPIVSNKFRTSNWLKSMIKIENHE